MAYSTLLTHLELESANEAVLAVSANLADMTHAEVIGIAACQPIPYYTEMPTAEVLELDRTEITRELAAAESQFRAALMGHAKEVSFRCEVGFSGIADYIASQARAADLIVTGPATPYDLMDTTRRTDIGALVMNAGRPVLIVPRGVESLKLDSAVIAWKDSREARRAVADALPLLERAKTVSVVEITPDENTNHAEERVKDVADWLTRQGIGAETHVRCSRKNDVNCLLQVFQDLECDLVVAGAYSHSRVREWSFGGVTMDLLMAPDRCALLSH
jgi:nucleotide-binding universal stress UspA family protein